jgi:hypothetical protein
MKYSQIQALTALAYCRELADGLDTWAKQFMLQEPNAARATFDLIEKVYKFLERMEQEAK